MPSAVGLVRMARGGCGGNKIAGGAGTEGGGETGLAVAGCCRETETGETVFWRKTGANGLVVVVVTATAGFELGFG